MIKLKAIRNTNSYGPVFRFTFDGDSKENKSLIDLIGNYCNIDENGNAYFISLDILKHMKNLCIPCSIEVDSNYNFDLNWMFEANAIDFFVEIPQKVCIFKM